MSDWWSSPFFRYTVGTAPALLDVLGPRQGVARGADDVSLSFLDFLLNTCLRSVGQVVFCNNPWSGLCILIAAAIDWKWSLGPLIYGIASVFISNLTALACVPSSSRPLVRNGLFGFNSFLVGLALPLFLYKGDGTSPADYVPDLQLALATILLPPLTVIVQVALCHFIAPCLTLPFNTVVLFFLLDSERAASRFQVSSSIQPSMVTIVPPLNASEIGIYADHFGSGLLKGVSQIFLINNVWSGAVILLGIAIYSRVTFAAYLVGSFLGLVWSTLLGAETNAVSAGLWSYNPALTFAAIAGVFTVPSLQAFALATAAALASCLFTGTLQTIFRVWGLPVLTLPFCFAAGLALCLRGKGEMMKGRDKKRDTRVANLRRLHHADSTHGRVYSPVGEEFADEDEEDAAALDRFGGVVFVDLAAITTPEGHYIEWKRRGYEVEDLAVEDVAAQNNAKEGEEQEIEFQDSFAIESE